jgi:carbon storage regulator CsrA
MLILTRKIDQGIVISGNILVRVLGVERDRVKIGISAPLEVTVLRQELLEREGKFDAEKYNRKNQNPNSVASSGKSAGSDG